MHTTYNPELADHTTRRTKPAPDPHQSTLRRICHFYNAGLPPQCLFELKFRDRLSAQVRFVHQWCKTPTTASEGVWEVHGVVCRQPPGYLAAQPEPYNLGSAGCM